MAWLSSTAMPSQSAESELIMPPSRTSAESAASVSTRDHLPVISRSAS